MGKTNDRKSEKGCVREWESQVLKGERTMRNDRKSKREKERVRGSDGE